MESQPPNPQGQTAQPSNDDSDILSARFLTNTDDDFWICTYSDSELIYWQAPVKYNDNGSGEAQFYNKDVPTAFEWNIGATLDIVGQDLSLTLFDVVVDTNPISMAANVAEGGSLSCSKLFGQFF